MKRQLLILVFSTTVLLQTVSGIEIVLGLDDASFTSGSEIPYSKLAASKETRMHESFQEIPFLNIDKYYTVLVTVKTADGVVRLVKGMIDVEGSALIDQDNHSSSGFLIPGCSIPPAEGIFKSERTKSLNVEIIEQKEMYATFANVEKLQPIVYVDKADYQITLKTLKFLGITESKFETSFVLVKD